MKTHEDVIDLGLAQEETRGALPAGQPDVQPGDRFILGGISADDHEELARAFEAYAL